MAAVLIALAAIVLSGGWLLLCALPRYPFNLGADSAHDEARARLALACLERERGNGAIDLDGKFRFHVERNARVGLTHTAQIHTFDSHGQYCSDENQARDRQIRTYTVDVSFDSMV